MTSLTIDPIFQVEDEKQRKISMVGSLVNLFMENNKQRATESMEQRKPKTNPFKVIFSDTVATSCLKERLSNYRHQVKLFENEQPCGKGTCKKDVATWLNFEYEA